MKYYFDIKETFSTTVAIEADDYEQAHQIVNTAYRRGELYFNYECADSMEIISVEEEDILTEEKFEILNCHDVVYDDEMEAYVCPVCGEYAADRWQIKDMEYPLPKYCDKCEAKLHY